MVFWDIPDTFWFPKILSLKSLVTRDATRINHVYYQYSRFVLLVVKGKFGQTSKNLLILWPRLSGEFSFSFYVFITTSVAKNCHILTGFTLFFLNKKYYHKFEKWGNPKSTYKVRKNFSTFFFCLGCLSRTSKIHRTAGEEGGYLFNFSLPLQSISLALIY